MESSADGKPEVTYTLTNVRGGTHTVQCCVYYNGYTTNGEVSTFTVEQYDDTTAYCTFISMLCEFAKNQKRINNKPDTSDNPKYTMRCYLLRLGMIGAEYKSARKVLLRNLSGSSAFRKAGGNDENSQ